jgi:arylsulfatase A-like enzyme
MIHHMDEGIGRVMAALKARGIDDNTLVVFTSDNGGERFSNNWPFVGQKMDLLEGGIRVPLLARWPSRIPAGGVSHCPNLTMDWTATMLSAAGVAADPAYPLDGVDLAPLFSDAGWERGQDLVWRMKFRQQRALVRGRWKYLQVDGIDYLFDVVTDARERANLVHREPQLLLQLREAWQAWNASMPPIPEDARVSKVFGERDMPLASA